MKHPIVPLRRLLAFKKCSSKYSDFVADAMQKIDNLPDKICQPLPPPRNQIVVS